MSTTGASFYITGGTMRQDAPSYVERRADRELYEALQRGEFCYVLTSRQMGKSSLMVHTAARLREAGIAVVVLDLTAVGQNLSADQWYGGLLRHVGRQLDASGRLEEELDDLWFAQEERVGPLERWMVALERVVLPAVGRRQTAGGSPTKGSQGEAVAASVPADSRLPSPVSKLVIFIDEIDAVRSLPFSTDEFFAAIRECYNRRTQDSEFQRLTFCLLGVATPSDLIQDTRTTPFNIGRRIELTDFTPTEAAPLGQGLGCDLNSNQALVQRVLYWTEGHPYLTQRLCQAVAEAARRETADGRRQTDEDSPPLLPSSVRHRRVAVVDLPSPADVDRLCEALFLSPQAREQDDNLLFVRERLLKSEADRASLLDLYGQVRSGRRVLLDDTNQLVSLLRLSGISRVGAKGRVGGPGRLVVRNRIYERVFDRAWITAHMPDAEIRRQRSAFRRGLLRAAAVSAVILAVMASLVVMAASQARRAKEGQRALRRHLYVAQMDLAQQAWAAGDLPRARELLAAQRPRPGQEELRGFEWRYLWRLCQRTDTLFTFSDPGGGECVAFSPDGRTVASGGGQTLRLWDAAAKRQIATLKAKVGGNAWAAAFSPDGKTVAAADDNTVKLWEVATRRLVSVLRGHREEVGSVVFSPDGKTLASCAGHWVEAHRPGEVKLWDLAAKRERATLRAGQKGIYTTAFSPDGKTVAVACDNGTIELWDAGFRRRVAVLKGPAGKVFCVAFSPNGKTLASSGGGVRLWDVATHLEVATLPGHKLGVPMVRFSPDGKTLATAGYDNLVKLWGVATKQELKTLKGHEGPVNAVAFSPDGALLASASNDQTVKLWDVARKPDTDILTGHKLRVQCIAFSPDGKTLASGSRIEYRADVPGELKLWDVGARRVVADLPGHRGRVWSVAFSPDGKTLASGSDDQTVRLWDAGKKREYAALSAHRGAIYCVAFSPDGKTLVSGGGPVDEWSTDVPGELTLWDVSNQREVATLTNHRGSIRCVAFSRDGKILASGGADSTIRLWDVAARRQVAALTGHKVGVNSVAFSPDGKTLASGSDDNGVKLWDLATHQEIATLRGHTNGVMAIAFSPDGKSLVSGSYDCTVKLWNLATAEPVCILEGHPDAILGVAFSPDGTLLATGSADRSIRLWRAPTAAETDSPARSLPP